MEGSVAGVDGCKEGWLAVTINLNTRAIDVQVPDSAKRLFATLSDLEVLAIDIPIGLPDREPRACDVEARRLLGPGRGSSVFPAPARATLAGETFTEVCGLSKTACGRRVSRQTFGILPKIREVDSEVRRLTRPQDRVREVHPEVSFYFWAGEQPMRCSKTLSAGKAERLALVETSFPGIFQWIRAQVRRRAVSDDDILDALAALWTASRISRGEARTLPESPSVDSCGLRMEIVA